MEDGGSYAIFQLHTKSLMGLGVYLLKLWAFWGPSLAKLPQA